MSRDTIPPVGDSLPSNSDAQVGTRLTALLYLSIKKLKHEFYSRSE